MFNFKNLNKKNVSEENGLIKSINKTLIISWPSRGQMTFLDHVVVGILRRKGRNYALTEVLRDVWAERVEGKWYSVIFLGLIWFLFIKVYKKYLPVLTNKPSPSHGLNRSYPFDLLRWVFELRKNSTISGLVIIKCNLGPSQTFIRDPYLFCKFINECNRSEKYMLEFVFYEMRWIKYCIVL